MAKNSSWLSRRIALVDHYTRGEELANALSHLLGFTLALMFTLFLLKDEPKDVGLIIYGLTLSALYGSSTLYHWLPQGDAKRLMRLGDHLNIYLLIAGTYTPLLFYLGSTRAFQLLAFIWAIALCGILFTLLFFNRFKALHLIFYLTMGWSIVFFWSDIVPYLPGSLFYWIIAGGSSYSVGTIFYSLKKIPFNHLVWHLFCLASSLIFTWGYLLYLR